MADPSRFDRLRIESYRDYRRAIKGATAASLRELYDSAYYERHVGNEELARVFFDSLGLEATVFTKRPLELADIRAGDRVLDVGCGRGEIVFQAANLGAVAVGLDFSNSAIEIAESVRARLPEEIQSRTTFICGIAEQTSFADRSFDKVFLLDVVEHLAPDELRAVLEEIRRLLDPRGKLVVHTYPNRWARTYGYGLKYVAYRLRGRPAPRHPIVSQFELLSEGKEYDQRTLFLHINEQSVASLKRSLVGAGFRSHVWLEHTGNPWAERGGLAGVLAAGYRLAGLKFVFGWGVSATATPR